MGSTVTLSWDELRLAAVVGVERQLAAMRLARPEIYGWDANRDRWGTHIEAAAAEMAFAKHRGNYWLPLAEDPAKLDGDVGKAQIRSTQRPDGSLLLHARDADDAPFILLTGTAPTFVIAGWIWGRDGKHEKWWRETDRNGRRLRPAFFVPQQALKPVP